PASPRCPYTTPFRSQWRHEYRTVTLRSDLARIFEDLLVGVNEWADEDGSEEARALATDLEDLYSRIEEPIEDTDRAAEGESPPRSEEHTSELQSREK